MRILHKTNRLVLTLLVFTAASISGFIVFLQYNNYIEESLEKELIASTGTILDLFDLSDMEKYVQWGQTGDRRYDEIVNSLESYAGHHDYPYIYLLMPKDEEGALFTFVFDLDPLSFLTDYNDAPSEVSQAFQEERVIISRPYKDKWGHFISAFSPVWNESGDIAGILGIDIEITRLEKMKKRSLHILLTAELAAVFVVLLFSRIFKHSVSLPLERARKKADLSDRRYKKLFENSPISLWEEDFSKVQKCFGELKSRGIRDLDSYLTSHPDELVRMMGMIDICDVNRETLKLLEADDKALLLGPLSLPSESLPVLQEELVLLWKGEGTFEKTVSYPTFKGRIRQVLLKMLLADRGDNRIIVSLTDLTERLSMENQLHQSRKLQAIGQLAGGVAHDFNNILTGIMGYAELSLDELPREGPARKYYGHIISACERAGNLVSKILTFSKQGKEEKILMPLDPVIREAVELLRASLPSSISINLEMTSPQGIILANATNMHEIIMNLATNAMQAMDQKGHLDIRLRSIETQRITRALPRDLPPGSYMVLEIEDDGPGISDEIIDRIFDPFFTTREIKGTGLGLSMVYGIIEAHNGGIHVRSRIGEGSLFQVFFPLIPEEMG